MSGLFKGSNHLATFVDGCFKYNAGQGWTVHAYAANAPQPLGWYLVGASTSARVARLPGTVGWAVGAGAYADFEACVTANKQLGSVEFDFAGGKLGVWLLDDNYPDNVVGMNGRNPKWRIVKLGACP